jgi:hypothetical protein
MEKPIGHLENLKAAVDKNVVNLDEVVAITAAINTKVAKDKNIDVNVRRRYLLEIVDAKNTNLDIFVALIDNCQDHKLFANVTGIIRECVAARSEFRPRCLSRLVGMNLTNHLVNVGARMYKQDLLQVSVSNEKSMRLVI